MLWLLKKFSHHPDRKGIIYGDRVYSYGELKNQTQWYTSYLKDNGVVAGDVTAVVSGFSFHSIALFLALAEMSCIVVPLDPDNLREIDQAARDAFIDSIFRFEGDKVRLVKTHSPGSKHPLISRLHEQQRAGMILFSSGTTGQPKVMLHDLSRIIDSYETEKLKDTNSLILLGFDHIGGIDSLLRLLSICATITLSPSRKPDDICAQIEKHKVNVLPTTPTFLNLLLISGANRRYDLSSLEIIGFGAEAMSRTLLQQLKQAFPGVRLQQKFGTSETNAIRIKNNNEDEQYFSINDPGVEYKIVEGELWLKSKNNILGYLNIDLPAFDEGWFRTGDLVEMKNGQLRIAGRIKEMINVGGEKVLPGDVEDVLLEMPEILDCKVYGIENLLTGQVVAADVVPAQGTVRENLKANIRRYCKQKLIAYQVPVKINIVEVIELSARSKKIRS